MDKALYNYQLTKGVCISKLSDFTLHYEGDLTLRDIKKRLRKRTVR